MYNQESHKRHTCIALRPASDSECFARSRLTVSKDGAVDALHEDVNRGPADTLEDLVLFAFCGEDAIENKLVLLSLVVDQPAAGRVPLITEHVLQSRT